MRKKDEREKVRKRERKEKRKEEKKEGERKMETVRPINPEDQSTATESLTGIEAGKSCHLANTQEHTCPPVSSLSGSSY